MKPRGTLFYTTGEMALTLNKDIPEFELKDQDGKLVSSNELIKDNYLVVFFYPKNFTPGCTAEACEFRDRYQEFLDLGAQVVGISSDSERSHQRFASKFKLPYPLLSDDKGMVRKLFGVKSSMLGLLPGRETFLFDPSGKLIFKFNSLDAKPHIRKAINFLKKEL